MAKTSVDDALAKNLERVFNRWSTKIVDQIVDQILDQSCNYWRTTWLNFYSWA